MLVTPTAPVLSTEAEPGLALSAALQASLHALYLCMVRVESYLWIQRHEVQWQRVLLQRLHRCLPASWRQRAMAKSRGKAFMWMQAAESRTSL